ncbi:acyl-CoA synthetase (NDP forming) [Bradyrhizobium sp. LM4.3]
MYADELANCGALSYAEFHAPTVNELRSFLPDIVTCRNPLDFWGIEKLEEDSRRLFQTIAGDPNVDIFATLYDPSHSGRNGAAYETWADCAVEVAAKTNKLVALMTPVDGSNLNREN